MPDMSRLTEAEQAELLELLEDESLEPPTIIFTVRYIASQRPPRVLPPLYPPWWKGQAWWDALPIAKRRELAGQGFAR